MNRSLVICMALSVATGGVAGAGAVLAGWGWLAGLALYSGVGSTSLVGFTLAASGVEPQPARVRASREKPAYA